MPKQKGKAVDKFEELFEELKNSLRNVFDHMRGDTVPLKGQKDEEETEAETDGGDDEDKAVKGESEVDFPNAKAISKLKGAKLKKVAGDINLEIEDLDDDEIKALLTTVANVVGGETDDLEEEEVTELCKALALTPKKKLAANIDQLTEYFGASEDAAEETDDDDKKDKDEDAEDADADADAASDDDDGVDRADIAKSADLPDVATMKEQLEAFNEAADEDDQIEIEPNKTKAAYRKLLELLVDSEGDIAEWGEPYIRNGEVCCCGLGLDEHTIKGKKGQFGKCKVSEKVFEVDEDGSATEVKTKK